MSVLHMCCLALTPCLFRHFRKNAILSRRKTRRFAPLSQNSLRLQSTLSSPPTRHSREASAGHSPLVFKFLWSSLCAPVFRSPKQTRSEKERHRSSSRQRQGSPYHSRSKRPPEASLRLSPRRNSRDRSSERPRDRDRDRDREGARDREGTRDRERRGARDREREGDRYRQAGDTGPSRSGTWDASPRGERNAPSHWRHSSRSPRSRLPSPSKHQRRRSTSSLEPRGSAPSRRERDTNSGKLSDSRALNSQLPHRDSSRDRRGRRSFSRGRG